MTDYAAQFTQPIPNPVGEPSAWWKGIKALEWQIRRGSPLFDYLETPVALDEPIRFKFKMRLGDGSLKVIFTQAQIQRAARRIYGIES